MKLFFLFGAMLFWQQVFACELSKENYLQAKKIIKSQDCKLAKIFHQSIIKIEANNKTCFISDSDQNGGVLYRSRLWLSDGEKLKLAQGIDRDIEQGHFEEIFTEDHLRQIKSYEECLSTVELLVVVKLYSVTKEYANSIANTYVNEFEKSGMGMDRDKINAETDKKCQNMVSGSREMLKQINAASRKKCEQLFSRQFNQKDCSQYELLCLAD